MLNAELDRYVLSEHLAEGGMGAIYLGTQVGAGGSTKEVVLKQLLPEFTTQPEFIGLFLREAKLSATLDHVNIVRTIDLVTSGNDYFIVMEYIRGADLRTVLRKVKRGPERLSPQAGLYIAHEVLSALDYAHNRKSADGQPLQLIHRDVSPSNVMISIAGEVKLADFGIAKVSTHKSVFYRVKGKAGYMSPEQALGDRPIDHRSDLYSLAVCLYEILAAERLFVADLICPATQIYSQQVPQLEARRGMPNGIDHLLAQALARDPDERFQTAQEFQEAVLQLAYNNNLLCSATDLADELCQTCGNTPQAWRDEDDVSSHVEHQTEIFSEAARALSRVDFTSILQTPFQQPPRPAKWQKPISSGKPFHQRLTHQRFARDVSTGDVSAERGSQPAPAPPSSFAYAGQSDLDEDATMPFFPSARVFNKDPIPPLADVSGEITDAHELRRVISDHRQSDEGGVLATDAPPARPSSSTHEIRDGTGDSGSAPGERPMKQVPGQAHRTPSNAHIKERRMLLLAGVLLLASTLILVIMSLLGHRSPSALHRKTPNRETPNRETLDHQPIPPHATSSTHTRSSISPMGRAVQQTLRQEPPGPHPDNSSSETRARQVHSGSNRHTVKHTGLRGGAASRPPNSAAKAKVTHH